MMKSPRILLPCMLLLPVVAFETPTVFPVSVRQVLTEKSKKLNTEGQYTTAGWSNRAATILTPVSTEGIYTADRPFYWNKIDVGCRCTVIEMPAKDGGDKPDLWVHSPVALDGPLKSVLDTMGTVKYVISPNYEHVKFAPEWYLSYTDQVQMWGNPGLQERMPDIPFQGEIPYHYRPVSWKGNNNKKATTASSEDDEKNKLGWDTNILQPLHLDCEVNPFTGRPFFNEVIYYHEPTKTLLTTDLFWNYPSADGIPNSQYGRDDSWALAPKVDDVPVGSQLWKFGMDQIYLPFYNNFMLKNKDAYRDICHHIINVWDVETVIPAHGDILRGKEFIAKVLKEHFQL